MLQMLLKFVCFEKRRRLKVFLVASKSHPRFRCWSRHIDDTHQGSDQQASPNLRKSNFGTTPVPNLCSANGVPLVFISHSIANSSSWLMAHGSEPSSQTAEICHCTGRRYQKCRENCKNRPQRIDFEATFTRFPAQSYLAHVAQAG